MKYFRLIHSYERDRPDYAKRGKVQQGGVKWEYFTIEDDEFSAIFVKWRTDNEKPSNLINLRAEIYSDNKWSIFIFSL